MRLTTLQVVHACHAQALAAPLYFPSREALPGSATAVGVAPPEEEMQETLEHRAEFQEAIRRQAEDLLEGLLREVGEAVEGVDVQRTVVEDRHPAEALVELSTDADMLVVGSRAGAGSRACRWVGQFRRPGGVSRLEQCPGLPITGMPGSAHHRRPDLGTCHF